MSFTVPFDPHQYTAPALRFAVLLINVEFSTLPQLAPSNQFTAPPFVPASFDMNLEFFTVMFSHTAFSFSVVSSVIGFSIKIAPPRYFAIFSVKFEFSMIPCEPIHSTAPPSPPPILSVISPIAVLLVNVEAFIEPCSPLQ